MQFLKLDNTSEEYPSVICSSTSQHETKHRNKTRVPRYIKHTSNVARTKRTQLFPLTKVYSRCCSRLPRSPISWKNKTKTQELTSSVQCPVSTEGVHPVACVRVRFFLLLSHKSFVCAD